MAMDSNYHCLFISCSSRYLSVRKTDFEQDKGRVDLSGAALRGMATAGPSHHDRRTEPSSISRLIADGQSCIQN